MILNVDTKAMPFNFIPHLSVYKYYNANSPTSLAIEGFSKKGVRLEIFVASGHGKVN